MSLQNSFNKIRRNAGIKKCVMIDGNVGDVYLDDKNKIVTLREFLEAMFKDMDYQDIVYWDRVEGATGAIDKLTLTDEVEVEGDAYDLGDEEEETPKAQQGLFKSTTLANAKGSPFVSVTCPVIFCAIIGLIPEKHKIVVTNNFFISVSIL